MRATCLPNTTEIRHWLRPYGPYGSTKTNFSPSPSLSLSISLFYSILFYSLLFSSLLFSIPENIAQNTSEKVYGAQHTHQKYFKRVHLHLPSRLKIQTCALIIRHQISTWCTILTRAHSALINVNLTVGTCVPRSADAPILINLVLAGCLILTRVAGAFINVDFTVNTCGLKKINRYQIEILSEFL